MLPVDLRLGKVFSESLDIPSRSAYRLLDAGPGNNLPMSWAYTNGSRLLIVQAVVPQSIG